MKPSPLIALLFSCCIAVGQDIRIDHVIAVTNDLDQSIEQYSEMGFTTKKGRLHPNGLHNAHIKFANNSSFELITLEGIPKDNLARTYAELLSQGPGGVFLALTASDRETITAAFINNQIAFEVAVQKAWTYITFPDEPDLQALFIIFYHKQSAPEEQFTSHTNSCNGILRVQIEGNERMVKLFTLLDLRPIDSINSNELARFQTVTGEIVVMDHNSEKRERITRIDFDCGNTDDPISIQW